MTTPHISDEEEGGEPQAAEADCGPTKTSQGSRPLADQGCPWLALADQGQPRPTTAARRHAASCGSGQAPAARRRSRPSKPAAVHDLSTRPSPAGRSPPPPPASARGRRRSKLHQSPCRPPPPPHTTFDAPHRAGLQIRIGVTRIHDLPPPSPPEMTPSPARSPGARAAAPAATPHEEGEKESRCRLPWVLTSLEPPSGSDTARMKCENPPRKIPY
jgi:hypothetical protein